MAEWASRGRAIEVGSCAPQRQGDNATSQLSQSSSNRSPPTGSNSTRIFQPISSNFLKDLLRMEPSEAAIQLGSTKESFAAGLEEPTMDAIRQRLFWDVLAHISDNDGAPSTAIMLLTMVVSSKFVSTHLRLCLLNLRVVAHQKSVHECVSLIAIIITVFEAMLPNRAAEIKVPLVLMTDVVSLLGEELTHDVKPSLVALLQFIDSLEAENKPSRQKQRNTSSKPPPDDFREQSIIPTYQELLPSYQPYLRPHIVNGTYPNIDHYLDVQFRLMKEDFIQPLRRGLAEYLRNMRVRPENRVKVQDIRIYENVKLDKPMTDRSGVSYRMSFKRIPTVNWEMAKRLIYGSLVLLSDDDFKTYVPATVANSEASQLARGLVEIRLIDEEMSSIVGKTFVMVESMVYFEAYRHVLVGLQRINPETLPMARYILDLDPDIQPPTYLLKQSHPKLDVSNLMTVWKSKTKGIRNKHSQSNNIKDKQATDAPYPISVLNEDAWPVAAKTDLNPSQLEAVKAALTQELSLIQGPPGTGKTYTALKIVRTLLRNMNSWADNETGPIMLLCYTNHALDQFLLGIMRFHDKGIIRVGGRSKCEELEPHNLNNVIQEKRLKRNENSQYIRRRAWNIRQETEVAKRALEGSQLKMQLCTKGILRETEFNQFHIMSDEHFNSLTRMETTGYADSWMIEWLFPLGCEKDFKKNDSHIAVFFEDLWSSNDISTRVKNFLKEKISMQKRMHMGHVSPIRDVWRLNIHQRWTLYYYWLSEYMSTLESQLLVFQNEYIELCAQLQEAKDHEKCMVLQEATIIGMTTTRAASEREVLRRVKPKIIIVEEAAEVLESHIITSLHTSCEQLILIGDHQQLRPKPSVYELATRFHLDFSMFERLVTNEFPYMMLQQQHRMRPEISALMRDHFYPELEDDKSVYSYEDVHGLEKNVFFLDHNEGEAHVRETTSHYNIHEVDFTVALCKYLLDQDYKPEQITILTVYTGQLLKFRERMDKATFEGVKVSSVDNYQGEENDIILLSFVRSSKNGKIGFLDIENRVCVSLSRAKIGLYCIGNFTLYAKKSSLWKGIYDDLKANCRVGKMLILQCYNHPHNKTGVAWAADFKKVCALPCDTLLDCGHICVKNCHLKDRLHQEYMCPEQCTKTCERGHVCPDICGMECLPCRTEMEMKLPCGHVRIMKCSTDPKSINCPMLVKKTKLHCDHLVTLPCHQEVDRLDCTARVERRLHCGHTITEKCRQHNKTGFAWAADFKKACAFPCDTLLDCGHKCVKNCHLKDRLHQEYMCPEQCTKTCERGHVCPDICGMECLPCRTKMKKKLPCGHVRIMKCSTDPKSINCPVLVTKTMLHCDHLVTLPCHQDVDRLDCTARVQRRLHCGHTITEKCRQHNKTGFAWAADFKKACAFPCDTLLDCGHKCVKNCHLKDRLHQEYMCPEQCTKTCERGHVCPDICGMECLPCRTKMEKKLPCGHVRIMKCSTDPKSINCPVLVTKTMLHCDHLVTLPCHQDVDRLDCTARVQRRLHCGHTITEKCRQHNKTGFAWAADFKKACAFPCDTLLDCGHMCVKNCHLKDRLHQEYMCPEQCTKTCERGHVCPDICGMECLPCRTKMEKKLPCGHVRIMKCSTDPKSINCPVLVTKTMLHWDHLVISPCHQDVDRLDCTARVDRRLHCGHTITEKCRQHNKTGFARAADFKCHEQRTKTRERGHVCPDIFGMECLPCQII